MRTLTHLAIVASLLCGCRTAAPLASADLASLRQQVTDTERAFAKSMADRDHAAFTSFLADEAIFFSGDSPVRGKSAVAAQWKPFFEKRDPPFSWEPDQVQVLDSGDLALSTGPVRDPAGNVVGRFNSIWRREAPGMWRIVFDKGSPVCKRAE
jgi:ketosteroid isomerase-like protein